MLSECIVTIAVSLTPQGLLQPASRAHFRYQSVLSPLVLAPEVVVLSVIVTNILVGEELLVKWGKLCIDELSRARIS